jgi:peptide/nickel transport system substrate-binding protein
LVERVAQNRILAERFPDSWDRSRVHLYRASGLPLPGGSGRLAILQAGAVELAEIARSDVATVRRDAGLRLLPAGTVLAADHALPTPSVGLPLA